MLHDSWRPAALVIGCALVGFTATAQTAPVPSSARPSTSAMAPRAATGTFQLVPLTNKVEVGLTTDALAEIERRRRDDEEVSWQLNSYARVRILPRRVIQAAGFQPLAPIAPPPAQ